jgi:phosphoglycolate phosphatase
MIGNFICDVDGTLLDSRRDIAAAQQHALKWLGVNHFSPEDLYPHIGKPLAETFRELLPPDLHHRIAEATDIYRDYYRPRALETTTLFPGVEETLKAMHGQGRRFAVATTKSTETSLRILTHFGIGGYFDFIQGSPPGTPFKPDPHIIHLILDRCGWNPRETVMTGDSAADIGAGKAAGILTCGVTYGSLGREEMEKLKPDFIIDTFAQLRDIA